MGIHLSGPVLAWRIRHVSALALLRGGCVHRLRATLDASSPERFIQSALEATSKAVAANLGIPPDQRIVITAGFPFT